MHAMIEFTEGLERLKAIAAAYPAESIHWSEAENRFQLIDRLFTECLGWDRALIHVEVTDEAGGRADYLLGQPANAILEAKKEALVWNLPPGTKPNKLQKLNSLTNRCRIFESVVLQVIPYCSIRGVPIAIVSNGRQLAVFQAITLGYPPLEGDCYVFNSIEQYISNFPLLWDLLSPEGVEENKAYQGFARHRNPKLPAKAATVIAEPLKYRYRSDLQEDLRTLGSLLLEEIEDNPQTRREFYKECYVPIEANNRHLLLSKSIIERRYQRASDDGVVPAPLDGAADVKDLIGRSAAHAGSRPIVVLGDVGVGKSSFFENLHLSLQDADSDNLFVTIDLGIKANLTSDVKTFILDEVPRVLRDRYNTDIFNADFVDAIYYRDLKSFEGSPDGRLKEVDQLGYQRARIDFLKELTKKSDKHLHAALAHLTHGQKKIITLVIDNADQRTFAVQQEAFLIAQELAATRNLLVFVALRPSTFYLSKSSGALSAYQNKVLTISPAPADEVVQRRLAFAVRVAEGKAAPAALTGIRFNLSNVVAFLRATLRSVRKNEDIRQFLSNISGGNTRSTIELVTSFCGSPNVDAKKIIEIEKEKGEYTVPVHEFTKHALLGEYSYFNQQSSLVACNIFDVSRSDPREHFIASLLIAFISSDLGVRNNDGFVSGLLIRQEMGRHGFLPEQVASCLRKLASRRLIETPHSHFREIPVNDLIDLDAFHFRATSSGLYHIRFWCGTFSFLDATSTDTPIFDESARLVVFETASSFEIKDRYRKAVRFKSYLSDQWNRAHFSCDYFDFSAVVQAAVKSFDTVSRFLNPPKPRRSSGYVRR